MTPPSGGRIAPRDKQIAPPCQRGTIFSTIATPRTQTILMRTLQELSFDNTWLTLPPTLWARVQPQGIREPRLVSFNAAAAALLNLDPAAARDPSFLAFAAGHALPQGCAPLAQKYTGHQFGVYNPNLGDGRGLLLGEVRTHQTPADGDLTQKWDLHLKGAGTTPFSRGADGRAVLRSSIREYLCSEAMHGLGIPTTRALCVVTGSDIVQRERPEPVATLLRMSESHVRFGHFEYLFYTQQHAALAQLADYVIAHHYPEHRGKPARHALLLRDVIARTASMIAQWQAVGFNHGVMNTDNMSILGATFDYGPFAFFDAYDARYICNHSDYDGRYAFHRQPAIGLWNLNALAHALSPLIAQEQLPELLQGYEGILTATFAAEMRAKLGLREIHADEATLLQQLFDMLQTNAVDYPIFFRKLCDFCPGETNDSLRNDIIDRQQFDLWAALYSTCLQAENSDNAERAIRMRRKNPKYVLRNWVAQTAITAANTGDFTRVNQILQLVQQPFDEWPQHEHFAAIPPDWGKQLEISCSS